MEGYEFVDEFNYRRLRWTKDDKTKQEGWKWFAYEVAKQVTNRETELEVPKSKRKKAVWLMEWPEGAKRPTAIYVTCPECAGMMNAKDHRIKADGELDPCIVCPQCHRHNFMRLKGWDRGPLESVRTEEDKKWEAKYGSVFERSMGALEADMTGQTPDTPVDPLDDTRVMELPPELREPEAEKKKDGPWIRRWWPF